MIKLFESWRKYLKEDVYGKDFLLKLGLTYLFDEGDFEIQIVYKDETTGQLKVVGMIETMQMGDTGPSGATPCIPETREIGAAAVDKEFQGKGLGTYLYEVASFLVTTHDGGYHTAILLNGAGANVIAVVDGRTTGIKGEFEKEVNGLDIPIYKGLTVHAAHGKKRINRVDLGPISGGDSYQSFDWFDGF